MAEQILDFGFWPDRIEQPMIAFSLSLLDFYRRLSLTTQTAAFGFCEVLHGIYKLTTAREPHLPKSLYEAFLEAMKEYRASMLTIETTGDEIKTYLKRTNQDHPIPPRPRGANDESGCSDFRAGDVERSRSRLKIFDETGVIGSFCARFIRHLIPGMNFH